MSILNNIAKVLRYPQSVATGIVNARHTGELTDSRGNVRDYDPFIEGLKGNLTPGKFRSMVTPGNRTTRDKIIESGMDIVLDPVNLLAGSGLISKGVKAGAGHLDEAGKAASIINELVRGASSVGKIEDASKIARLGQGARYLYQGTAAAEEGAGGILQAAMLAAGFEKGAAKVLSRLGTKAAEDIVGQGAEKALSKTGLDKLSDVLETRPNSTIAKQLMMALRDDGTQLSFPGMGQPGKAVATVDPAIAQQLGFPGLEANKQLSFPGFSRVNPPAIPAKTKAPRVNPPVAPKAPRVNPPAKPALQAFKDLKLPKELTETAGGPIIMGPGNTPVPVATLIKAIKNLDSGTYRSANPSKIVAKVASAPVEKAVPAAKKAVAKKAAVPVAKKAAEKPKPKQRMIVTKPKAKITDAEALALLQAMVEKG